MCVCARKFVLVFIIFHLSSSSGEEEVAHGMKVWRKALTEVRSAAQLAMCIQQLQKSIAWERSIMKVVSRKERFVGISFPEIYVCLQSMPFVFCFFCSIARCARKGIMKTSSCCVTAVIKAVTLIVTNPKYLLSQRETGTAHLAYPRYHFFPPTFFVNCITFWQNGFI